MWMSGSERLGASELDVYHEAHVDRKREKEVNWTFRMRSTTSNFEICNLNLDHSESEF